MPFAVTIHEKGGQPRRQEFDKAEVTIGRVQGNDIILPKQNVSKRHSRIVVKDGKFIIVDLKSTNGTYVNGRKIASPMVIKETDKIYIGDFILSTEPMEGGAAAEAPAAEARPKAPPPPPKRSKPPEPKPAPPASATPRPRTGRPSATPEPRPKPDARPAPAPGKHASAAPEPAPAAAATPPADRATPVPSTITATAEQAPAELYRWLVAYAAEQDLSLPASYNMESGLHRDLSTTLKGAAAAAVDGISGIDAEAVAERAVAEVLAAGALSELLGDSSIERIYVNAPDAIWITRGGDTTRSSAEFSGAEAMVDGARRLLADRGIGVNGTTAFAGGYLADGTRIHFTSGQSGGPFITVDRPNKSGATLEDLVERGALNENMAAYLRTAVQLGRVIVVSSNDLDTRFEFIAALVANLEEHTRSVLLESGGRLAPPNDCSIVINGAPGNDELVGQILRMCPDYLVAADTHGVGTLEALGAMGNSINGGLVGVDAESPDDALIRLARQSALSTTASSTHIEAMLRDRIDLLVQILAYSDGTFRVTQVMDVDGDMQETFSGFDGFSGSGQTPRWYENAISLGHQLQPNIFD